MEAFFLIAILLAAPWKSDGSEKGFTIEKRPAKTSGLYETRISGPVDLPPKAIFDVLWDVDSQKAFAPHVKRLDVLARQDDSVLIYEQVAVPAATDRDYVLRLKKSVDAQTGLYQVAAEAAQGQPLDKDHVRMTNIWSQFTIEPGDNGGSVISYHSFGDPAGDLPTWLKNAAATKAPLDFVLAIVAEAKRRAKR
jgi:hypothetical protein